MCQTGTNRIFHFFICSMVVPSSAMSTNTSKNVLLACPHERCPRMFTSSRSLNAHLSGCPFLPCINPRLPRCSPRKATQDGHLPDRSQTTTYRFHLCTVRKLMWWEHLLLRRWLPCNIVLCCQQPCPKSIWTITDCPFPSSWQHPNRKASCWHALMTDAPERFLAQDH